MAKEVDVESIKPTGTKPKVQFKYEKSPPDPHLSNRTKKANKKVTFNENPIILNTLTRDYLISNNADIIPSRASAPRSAQSGRTRKVQSSKSASQLAASTSQPVSQKLNAVTRSKLNKEAIKDKPSECYNVFGRPELHSSLWVAEKLKAIELDDFNSKLVVKNKLETCAVTKQKIDQKSSRPVNVPLSEVVFHDIVPLEFDQEALLTAAAEEKEAKLKAVLPVPRSRDPKPDIDEYLTEDMQPEFFTLPNPSVNFKQFRQPKKAPQSSVYNLYKHKRMWENLP